MMINNSGTSKQARLRNQFRIISKGSEGQCLCHSNGRVVLRKSLDGATEWTFHFKGTPMKGVTKCSISQQIHNDSYWYIVQKSQLSSVTKKAAPDVKLDYALKETFEVYEESLEEDIIFEAEREKSLLDRIKGALDILY